MCCLCVCVYGGDLKQGSVNRINRRFGGFKVCVGVREGDGCVMCV